MSGPICIEWDHRLCGEMATHEVYSALDGSWSAKCAKCVRYYNPKACSARPLTKARADHHELAQWRAGTLPLARTDVDSDGKLRQ